MSSTAQLLACDAYEQRDHGNSQPVEGWPGPTDKGDRRQRLGFRVLFPAARRLRRRRWAIGSAIALAALAAGALSYAVLRHSSATTAPKAVTSYSLSGPAITKPWVYFRPVECLIAPPSRDAANRAAPALAMSAGLETSSTAGICQLSAAQQALYPTTPSGKDSPKAAVVLPYYTSGMGCFVLGPAEMNASVIKTASAAFNHQVGSWQVNIAFTPAGTAEFNRYASQHYACYEKDPFNPPYCALQAIDLNGVVETAPAVEARSFPGGATISGMLSSPFTKAQAEFVASSVRAASKVA